MFKQLLVQCGVVMVKYYLDISSGEQKRRLKDRAEDPLNQWKTSPIDAVAMKYWKDYSEARNEMLTRTHSTFAPWTIVRADDKMETQINVIRKLPSRFEYGAKTSDRDLPDPDITFLYDKAALDKGLIAE